MFSLLFCAYYVFPAMSHLLSYERYILSTTYSVFWFIFNVLGQKIRFDKSGCSRCVATRRQTISMSAVPGLVSRIQNNGRTVAIYLDAEWQICLKRILSISEPSAGRQLSVLEIPGIQNRLFLWAEAGHLPTVFIVPD